MHFRDGARKVYNNRVFIGYKRCMLVFVIGRENAPKCNRTVTICYNEKPGELHAGGREKGRRLGRFWKPVQSGGDGVCGHQGEHGKPEADLATAGLFRPCFPEWQFEPLVETELFSNINPASSWRGVGGASGPGGRTTRAGGGDAAGWYMARIYPLGFGGFGDAGFSENIFARRVWRWEWVARKGAHLDTALVWSSAFRRFGGFKQPGRINAGLQTLHQRSSGAVSSCAHAIWAHPRPSPGARLCPRPAAAARPTRRPEQFPGYRRCQRAAADAPHTATAASPTGRPQKSHGCGALPGCGG